MFKNLAFKYKILFIPVVAALTFFMILLMNQSFIRKNENLLSRIVSGYVPALELSRDLLEIVDSIHLNFQNAVAARDLEKLQTGNMQRQRFVEFIEAEKNNPILNSEELEQLDMNFMKYFEVAYETSEKLIQGTDTKSLSSSLQSINSYYGLLDETLNAIIRRDNKNLAMGFGMTRNNNRIMMVVSSITITLCILVISLLSWFIIKSIGKSLGIAIQVAEKVAGGDLTVQVPSNGVHDEPGRLLKSFHGMVNNLRNMTNQIKEGAQALAVSSGQISTSVTQIAAGATETASAASETSTTVEEVRQTALDSNKKAKIVSESAQKAVQVSQSGEKAVSKTIEGMRHIEEQMGSIAESIMRLSDHGQTIGDIILTVEDVAEQSRLLAVNASIEAVKAGEQGKGFAVVAQEVRMLAEQSKQATARVRTILDDIQKSTSEAVMKTEQGSKAVEAGVKQSAEAGESIQRLANSVAEAAQATTQISVSSQEQLVGMEQVVSAMESIKQASHQNVAATKQVESATHDLHALGKQLTTLIENYRL